MSETSRDHLVGGVMCGWNAYAELSLRLIERAQGAHVWDPEGKKYIDWNMGWGSILLGHNPPEIEAAVQEAFEQGFAFQYESQANATLAEKICEATGFDRVRLGTTGTGVTQFAARLARAKTGRKIIVKFEGHFHGMCEPLYYGHDTSAELQPARSDGSFGPIPASAGMVEDDPSSHLLVLPFNDLEAIDKVYAAHPGEIAAIILEPISFNVGCIRPDDGYLEALRKKTQDEGSLLIFDEMRTGFRVARGGAAEKLGVRPDLATYGKALGCGLPISALAGSHEVMDHLGPVGNVSMGGTNNGRNFVVRGTIAALDVLAQPGFYEDLSEKNDYFIAGVRRVLKDRRVPGYVEGYGGTIGIYFGTEERPRDYRQVAAHHDRAYQSKVLKAAVEKDLFGFPFVMAQCPEAVVLSRSHTTEILDQTLERLDQILAANPYSKG